MDLPAPAWDLQQWLRHQERLSPRKIDLGLERVRAVGERLGVLAPRVPVITVAGTNGKGSIVAYLEAMIAAAGYRCGAYTSPHLLRYNERVRVDRSPCADEALVAAFEAVEAARGDVPLTYFEFGTLAALQVFRQAAVDVLVLEVGLGGRLDAVNALDPDVAVIASVGLDHADWLGGTLEAIAREKAGIMRPGRPAVFAAPRMPDALWAAAATIGARVHAPGRGYSHRAAPDGWYVDIDGDAELGPLTGTGIDGPHQRDNAAAAVMALALLRPRLPLPAGAMARGVVEARLPGRCQRLAGPVEWVLDVAHNADAVASLGRYLDTLPPAPGRCWALLGAMARKETEALLAPVAGRFDGYLMVTLAQDGAWPAEALAEAAARFDPDAPVQFTGTPEAVAAALARILRPGDRVVGYGSFHTVEWLLTLFRDHAGGSKGGDAMVARGALSWLRMQQDGSRAYH